MSDKQTPTAAETVPFYPDHVRTELRLIGGLVLALLVVGGLGLVFPVGLGVPADPLDTPAHVKPEWYFLGLYQLLKYIPKTAGAILPVAAVLVLLLWPFVDRRPDASPRARQLRLAAVVVFLVVLIALTVWGGVS